MRCSGNFAAFSSFDSKLVRLKVLGRLFGRVEGLTFRFQTGAIKRSDIIHNVKNETGFDSKLVRLKVLNLI